MFTYSVVDSMDHESFAAVQGMEMDAAEAESLLHEEGYGILSLAADGEAYGVPLSFGYDGEAVYFIYIRGSENSKKTRFARATDRASFLVYRVTGKHDWESVVVTGALEEVTDDEWPTLVDAIDDNAWFPSLFSQSEPMDDFVGWRLVVEEISGQHSG